jgi:hypothetical protein
MDPHFNVGTYLPGYKSRLTNFVKGCGYHDPHWI